MSTDTGRSHWLLAPASASDASLPVPLGDVTALLEQVGRSSASSDEVAGQLLHLLGRHVPLAQCTIFSFQGRSRPRIVGFGDRARTGALPMISQDYSERFYPLDGAQRVMQAELARLAGRFAHLTQRDLDVVRCVIEGLDAERLAQRLGITVSSARTYLKRVCAKLGVQGQRELFALLMAPEALS